MPGNSIGTITHMAPEVYNGVYTEKIDVYSFGIVIASTLLRKKPKIPNKNPKPKNFSPFRKEDEEKIKKCHSSLFNLYKKCLNGNYRCRPSMNDVVLDLIFVLKDIE